MIKANARTVSPLMAVWSNSLRCASVRPPVPPAFRPPIRSNSASGSAFRQAMYVTTVMAEMKPVLVATALAKHPVVAAGSTRAAAFKYAANCASVRPPRFVVAACTRAISVFTVDLPVVSHCSYAWARRGRGGL